MLVAAQTLVDDELRPAVVGSLSSNAEASAAEAALASLLDDVSRRTDALSEVQTRFLAHAPSLHGELSKYVSNFMPRS